MGIARLGTLQKIRGFGDLPFFMLRKRPFCSVLLKLIYGFCLSKKLLGDPPCISGVAIFLTSLYVPNGGCSFLFSSLTCCSIDLQVVDLKLASAWQDFPNFLFLPTRTFASFHMFYCGYYPGPNLSSILGVTKRLSVLPKAWIVDDQAFCLKMPSSVLQR